MAVHALVIDDSRFLRRMLIEVLRRSDMGDFEFAEAADGPEGIARFDPDVTSIVFIDWLMPEMSGLEAVGHLRSKETTGRVPVVVVSGETNDDEVANALAHGGVDAYVRKPVTVDALREAVGPLLSPADGAADGAGPPHREPPDPSGPARARRERSFFGG